MLNHWMWVYENQGKGEFHYHLNQVINLLKWLQMKSEKEPNIIYPQQGKPKWQYNFLIRDKGKDKYSTRDKSKQKDKDSGREHINFKDKEKSIYNEKDKDN